MACLSTDEPKPLRIPELVRLIISYVDGPPDLLNCACLNSTWSPPALQKLYRGSLNDMRFRTPDIGSLNCLLVASRERFARNMSFTDHLLLCPENVGRDEHVGPQQDRWACIEKCRPLRYRKSTELLLQAGDTGPLSVALPFEILHQDLLNVFDLVLHPGLEFLTIDDKYCKYLLPALKRIQDRTVSSERPLITLPKLEALTIYRSNPNIDILTLCQALRFCDLKFFQLQERYQLPQLSKSDVLQLLRTLSRHQKLQALALNFRCKPFPTDEMFANIDDENWQIYWPELRGLYLHDFDDFLAKKLMEFKELQVLGLANYSQRLLSLHSHRLVESIAKCSSLKVIDVQIGMQFDHTNWVLDIAYGCPKLHKLHIRTKYGGGLERAGLERAALGRAAFGMPEEQFSELLKALPHLEILELDIELRLSESIVRDFALYTPQLSLLQLRRCQIQVPFKFLTAAPSPISKLKFMQFHDIWLDRPRYFLDSGLQELEAEWRRVFPLLRYMPCADDMAATRHDRAVPLPRPPDEFDQDSDISIYEGDDSFGSEADVEVRRVKQRVRVERFLRRCLRRKLWIALGYDRMPNRLDHTHYMWQTDFEIEAFRWPVLPLRAFKDPVAYSSAD